LAITPNTTAYHASCYHEILRERLSNYHPFKRPLGVCVGGLASGFVSEKQNSGKTVPVKEFFGQLKNPQNSVNQESSVQSNVYTTYPKASSRSVFTSESVRRIEGHNPPIISVLPSLSSIFISTDNSFATLLHNTVSLTHTLNDSNNCSDSKMDDEGCDEYNLTTYLDEPIIASGLNPRYVQHMPVTYMITAPDNHGALPRGGPRNNVICANAITSSLPITEDSSLLDEQRKLYEIMRISGNKIPMKEVCYNFCFGIIIVKIEYEFANRYVDLEVVPKVNIKKFDISIPSIHHSVVQPSINQHSLDQTSQIKSISSSTSIQSSKTQPSLVESSQAQLSQVQSSKTPPSPVQPSKTQPDVIKPPLTQPSLIQSSQIQPFPIQSSRAQHSSIKSSETQDFPVQSSQTQHSQIPPSLTQPSLIQLPLVHDDVSHVIDTNFNNQNMTNRMNILLDNEIKSHSKRNFELRREQEREQQRQARNRLKEEIKSNNEYEEEKKKRKELEIKLEEERQLQQELEVERRICEEKEKEISIYG
jgi:hypothetical protein